MPTSPWNQVRHHVRFDWGPTAAAALADDGGTLVVVDVLSFTTAVSVAVDRGTAVHPAPWRDDRAEALARDLDARLAVGRRSVTAQQPWSLSPAALRAAPAPERLVLPSPNGSAIAACARGRVVAACLRNAGAVAGWLRDHDRAWPVTVIAAGERWPDGSLRPALEDLLGAGAVIATLPERTWSPEAEAAAALFRATRSVPDAVRRCASGTELIEAGFAEDVEIAVELDRSSAVPVLREGAFRA
ncbi:2-phosphosulfolactate phosphatase [Blastococcus fimeti]|nr:2-phosphosulfolactate phosphatase [Blastococcus fimeti]